MVHEKRVKDSVMLLERCGSACGMFIATRKEIWFSDFIRNLIHDFESNVNFQIAELNRNHLAYSYDFGPTNPRSFLAEGNRYEAQKGMVKVTSSLENMDVLIEILYWLNQPNNCLGLNQDLEEDDPLGCSKVTRFDEDVHYGQKPSWALFHLISQAICYTERDIPQFLKLGLEAYGLKFSDIFSWSILYPRLIPESVAVMDLWFENPTKTFKQIWEDLGM